MYFRRKKFYQMTTSKTWTRTLDPGPRPWTRTLKNLDPEKPGPCKTWALKNLDPEKPGRWKTWALKNLDPEKPGINIRLKNMSDFMELCFMKTIRNDSYCLKARVLTYHFPNIHRSVLREIIIDLLYFWNVYDVNLWEKNFGRSTAYSCRTNVFI